MTNKLSEGNRDLRDSLTLKDEFAIKRNKEKIDLVLLRQKFALELLDTRDVIAVKRHRERLDILDLK